MLKLLAPLPPRPPPPPPTPLTPAPVGEDEVIIYHQQGGNGTLRLGPANFFATKGMPGKGWDACPGAARPARFDNGAPVWGKGLDGMGQLQVIGSWAVRTIGACCFHYHYPVRSSAAQRHATQPPTPRCTLLELPFFGIVLIWL